MLRRQRPAPDRGDRPLDRRSTPTVYGIAATFAFLLQACAVSPGAETSAQARQGEQAPARDTTTPIQTEKLAYRDTMFIQIVATYRNRTGSTVRVDRCGLWVL